MCGLSMMKSAVASLVATGMFHTAARRSSALTSGSWAAVEGIPEEDHHVILPRRSGRRAAGRRPWGPEKRQVMGSCACLPSRVPVVPVA